MDIAGQSHSFGTHQEGMAIRTVPALRGLDRLGGAAPSGLSVSWARHQDDVRAAQRLRYQVFAGEMGARLSTPVPGHDIDLFDNYCEHLLVRDAASGQVVGTYRVLTPVQAKRVGSMVLQPPRVHVAPPGTFHNWLKSKGKLGGQNKVPRLMNDRSLIEELLVAR